LLDRTKGDISMETANWFYKIGDQLHGWFYKIGDQLHGPVPPAELRCKAAAGEVGPHTLVRKGTEGPWVQALVVGPGVPWRQRAAARGREGSTALGCRRIGPRRPQRCRKRAVGRASKPVRFCVKRLQMSVAGFHHS